jgi:hypothetical protein
MHRGSLEVEPAIPHQISHSAHHSAGSLIPAVEIDSALPSLLIEPVDLGKR